MQGLAIEGKSKQPPRLAALHVERRLTHITMPTAVKILATWPLGLVLSACASVNWYQAPAAAQTSAVRFTSQSPGNSGFWEAVDLDCKAPNKAIFGWFHPSGDQAWQANRRGFNRRADMPLGDIYPAHMYSEFRVEA